MKEESFSQAFVEGGGDFALWQHHHDHELHTAPMMAEALKQVFLQVVESGVSYLYRYLWPVLPESEQGYRIAMHLLDLEKRMASVGGIKLIGRRFVAHKD